MRPDAGVDDVTLQSTRTSAGSSGPSKGTLTALPFALVEARPFREDPEVVARRITGQVKVLPEKPPVR
jgi:hypothetical protein